MCFYSTQTRSFDENFHCESNKKNEAKAPFFLFCAFAAGQSDC
jgi:hypothetical protein